MVTVLTKAEAAADQMNYGIAAELYIKIADQWHDLAWRVAEPESVPAAAVMAEVDEVDG